MIGVLCVPVAAQRGRARRTPAPPPPPVTERAAVDCPSPLGTGLKTGRAFCDVLTGRDPTEGIIVTLPPHTGPVTLTFDLHNRHTYSEELVQTNRGYRHYTATIGVLTADNTLLSRAVVQNEFRRAADLIDRIGGGAGVGGVKAVAPTGFESISVMIPAEEQTVSILGEKLAVIRADAATPDNFTVSGRPIAVISNIMVTYQPVPPARGSTGSRGAPAKR
jgi:hypothetical protein